MDQLNDIFVLLKGLLVFDVVLLIQDKCYSINFDASPLSLYYFNVGHRRS